jgi:hypothetical protein
VFAVQLRVLCKLVLAEHIGGAPQYPGKALAAASGTLGQPLFDIYETIDVNERDVFFCCSSELSWQDVVSASVSAQTSIRDRRVIPTSPLNSVR